MSWFEALPDPPVFSVADTFVGAYFQSAGALVDDQDGRIDATSSPIVTLFPPMRRRGVLLTVGEVNFCPKQLRDRFPALHQVSQRFSRWLSQYPVVFPRSRVAPPEVLYHLEGSVQNYAIPIHALPAGESALRQGQYFVDHSDNDLVVDKLCQRLRLRGIVCRDA
jgi:hypothetical protein